MDPSPTPTSQDAQARRDAAAQKAWLRRLNDPEEFKKIVGSVTRMFTRKKTLSDIIASTRYYAAIEPLTENNNFRAWRDCRLYFDPKTTPARQEPNGCLGVVWLHNPSARFQPTSPPPAWDNIRIVRPDEPDHNTLNYVIGALGLALKDTNYTAPAAVRPHVNLEELVYVDSEGREPLWDGLNDDQIEQHSHTRVLNAANPGFRHEQPKFIWLAWGDLRTRPNRQQTFNRLVTLAQENALQSAADIIFAAEMNTPSGPITPTFHFSPAAQRWTMYWLGKTYEKTHPARWDIVVFPPLHPEALRRAEYQEGIQKDLAAAIANALT